MSVTSGVRQAPPAVWGPAAAPQISMAQNRLHRSQHYPALASGARLDERRRLLGACLPLPPCSLSPAWQSAAAPPACPAGDSRGSRQGDSETAGILPLPRSAQSTGLHTCRSPAGWAQVDKLTPGCSSGGILITCTPHHKRHARAASSLCFPGRQLSAPRASADPSSSRVARRPPPSARHLSRTACGTSATGAFCTRRHLAQRGVLYAPPGAQGLGRQMCGDGCQSLHRKLSGSNYLSIKHEANHSQRLHPWNRWRPLSHSCWRQQHAHLTTSKQST